MEKTKKTFYGNKRRFVNKTGYACKVELDRVATGVNIQRFRRDIMNLSREKCVGLLEDSGYLCISVQTLWKWETGKTEMGVGQLEALRQFFDKYTSCGCSHDELVVYQTREIGDDRDQPVPLIITYFSFGRTFANANVRLFLLTCG